MSSSPEVKKRNELKKIETELKNYQPVLFKNGLLQPNFGEIFRILYENTKPLEEILIKTVCSEDVQHNGRYESQLIMTGFSQEAQEKFEKLNYENRKNQITASDLPLNKVLEQQKTSLQNTLKIINEPEFARINGILNNLQRLFDICNFNYMNVIKAFDPEFDGITSVSLSNVKCVDPSSISNALQDLYFLSAEFILDSAEARAIIALKQLLIGREPDKDESEKIMSNLRKISAVLTKVLNPTILKKIIMFAQKDPAFVPQTGSYKKNSVKKFVEFIQSRFDSDTETIKGEIKDYTISFELKNLFGPDAMLELQGYNSSTNNLLRQNTPFSFIWVTPLQIIRTFVVEFLTDSVKEILESIIIEGFFSNQNHKTDFSNAVYAAVEISGQIDEFEKTFARDGKNDQANLVGLINDSKRNSDFLKKIGQMVDNINAEAHKLVQSETTNLYKLYKKLEELIVDSKKSKPDMVSNIKVLLSSNRNRENSGLLEQQLDSWNVFLKIMKNYAIVGEINDKNE